MGGVGVYVCIFDQEPDFENVSLTCTVMWLYLLP